MKYVLGIDSGGTKYRVRAADMNGKTLGEYTGQGCSHYQWGKEGAAERISANLARCLDTFGGRPEDCACIVCGSTGVDSPEDGEILNGIYDGLEGFSCPKECMNDAELAYRATVGTEGILVLAGTGSIVLGKRKDGELKRVGGWPKGLMGDEGSGRYLDALALRYYSRWLDGCRPYTPLIDAVRKAVGGDDRKALLDYSVKVTEPEFSSCGLAEAVNEAAERGNDYAREMLYDAAGQLAALASDMVKLLGMENAEKLPVGLWGGVVLHSRILRDRLTEKLTRRYPHTVIVMPRADAAQSAVEMALERAEKGVNQIRKGGI